MNKIQNIWSDIYLFMRDAANKINELIDGQTGTVTLATSATTTIVQDSRCGPRSFVSLFPSTASASAEAPYVVPAQGSFTVHHSSSTASDRTFGYLIVG